MTITPNLTPTSQILDAAADLIDFHGHATGCGWPGAETFTGPLCLEGGIMAALELDFDDLGLFWSCPAYLAVKSYLTNPEVNPAGLMPFMWQDALPHGHQQHPPVPGWVGGSEEAARAYAHERVTEVLRAAALLEAAREEAATHAPADRHEVAL